MGGLKEGREKASVHQRLHLLEVEYQGNLPPPELEHYPLLEVDKVSLPRPSHREDVVRHPIAMEVWDVVPPLLGSRVFPSASLASCRSMAPRH